LKNGFQLADIGDMCPNAEYFIISINSANPASLNANVPPIVFTPDSYFSRFIRILENTKNPKSAILYLRYGGASKFLR